MYFHLHFSMTLHIKSFLVYHKILISTYIIFYLRPLPNIRQNTIIHIQNLQQQDTFCYWNWSYFFCKRQKPRDSKRQITLDNTEFIRRYLMHVLPCGFQKIRYHGFLNNRMKSHNLKVIFKLQSGQRFKQRYCGLSMAELLKAVWNFDPLDTVARYAAYAMHFLWMKWKTACR